MLLRLSPTDWGRLSALLAILDWKKDFQGLSQLPSIRILEGKQFCCVADDLIDRLNRLQASLSWFSPHSDMSWFPPLLAVVKELGESVYQVPEPEPAPVPDQDIDLNADNDPQLRLTARDILGTDYDKLHNPLNCDRPKGW
jgi:hypothetical protein